MNAAVTIGSNGRRRPPANAAAQVMWAGRRRDARAASGRHSRAATNPVATVNRTTTLAVSGPADPCELLTTINTVAATAASSAASTISWVLRPDSSGQRTTATVITIAASARPSSAGHSERTAANAAGQGAASSSRPRQPTTANPAAAPASTPRTTANSG